MKYVPIRSILMANRGEIVIRVMRAATEMGLRTVAVCSQEDRFALHRFKADEAYQIGASQKPIAAYLDIDEVLRVAKQAKVDAIYSGYGFLSENLNFADACRVAGIAFIGPQGDVVRALGKKVAPRNLAESLGVPVMSATPPLPREDSVCLVLVGTIGYPVTLKGGWGGGGRACPSSRASRATSNCSPKCPWRALKRSLPSTTTRSFWRSWCSASVSLRRRYWATPTAACCTSTSVSHLKSARNSGAAEGT